MGAAPYLTPANKTSYTHPWSELTISQLKDMKHDVDNLDTSDIKTENLYESRTSFEHTQIM